MRGRSRTSDGPWKELVPATALPLLRRARRGDVPPKRPRDLSTLFADIEGCTRLCEDLPPHEMNEVIQTYFSAYLDAVRRHGGEVTEILGDGLLALFEGPDPAENVRATLDAAVEIQAKTQALNRRRARRHDPITVNIGLNAGRALVGLTRLRGRSGERWVYSATGPVTNVAARLCGLAGAGQILTTKATAALLPGGCDCRERGRHRLKNVSEVVEVVEVLPPARTRASQKNPLSKEGSNA